MMRRHVVVAVFAALALLFSGVAVAQEQPTVQDPQSMCESAGGTWDDGSQTCFDVWCGWEDDPPICQWMASQPGAAVGQGSAVQPAAPASGAQVAPDYTG